MLTYIRFTSCLITVESGILKNVPINQMSLLSIYRKLESISTPVFIFQKCAIFACRGTSIRGVLYHETEKITRQQDNKSFIKFLI